VSTPAGNTDDTADAGSSPDDRLPGSGPARAKQPSPAAGIILLVLAAVLIVVVLVQPAMAPWLKATVAILAVLVVVALLAYSLILMRSTRQIGRGR
jgi:peptidoglycan/LPS O-acetylase OafA/YrhL